MGTVYLLASANKQRRTDEREEEMSADPIYNFWAKQEWPGEMPGYLFLARAVHRVGEALCAGLWTGREPIPVRPLLPELTGGPHYPTPNRAPPWVQWEVHRMVAQHRPSSGRSSLQRDYYPPQFTQDDWLFGTQMALQAGRAHLMAQKRLKYVIDILRTACSGGLIRTYTRHIKGGDYTPLSPMAWNTENLSPRFALCQMDPANPFSNGVAGDRFQYVYVSSLDLEKVLEHLRSPQATASDAPPNRADEDGPPTEDDPVVEKKPQSRGLISAAKLHDWFMGEYLPTLSGAQPSNAVIEKAASAKFKESVTRELVRALLTKEFKESIGWVGRRGPRSKSEASSRN